MFKLVRGITNNKKIIFYNKLDQPDYWNSAETCVQYRLFDDCLNDRSCISDRTLCEIGDLSILKSGPSELNTFFSIPYLLYS